MFWCCPFRKSIGETLEKEGIDVKQLSAGGGGRKEVVPTVHQGRRGSISMVGSNRRRSVVGPVDDGEVKEVEQDIGGLISRLKNTITSDAEKREPSKIPLRKGDEFKTEGVKIMDAKQLATTTGEKVKKNQGRSVPQDAVSVYPYARAQHCWQRQQRCRVAGTVKFWLFLADGDLVAAVWITGRRGGGGREQAAVRREQQDCAGNACRACFQGG